MASAMAELEAAIAALPAKKQRLRESYDRLVANAPIPIPFTWDDINTHISSLQSSIAVRFLKLQSLQATAPTTTDPVEQRGSEDRKPYPEHHVRGDGEEAERANGACSDLNAEEGGDHGRAEEVTDASPDQADDDGEAIESENAKEAATAASPYRSNGELKEKVPVPDFAGGAEEAVRRDLVAACLSMDTSSLADVLYWRNKRCFRARRQFLPALLGAAEPHALVVGAVRAFLLRTEPKNDTHWENCVLFVLHAGNLNHKPSVGTLEQANRLARDWKEMVGKPESCRDLGRLALWGLLRFLVSYNITLEFHAHEIINHLANLPRTKKESCIELCTCLGLIPTMTDSVNHLIENGQELDAIRLACVLNLTDKYPPLSIMNEYVDKAKKTAREILSMESDSSESLNQAMTKQVNALILSWRAVDEYGIESVHRNSIKAEITRLLHEYAHKRQSLSDASSPSLDEEQQEQCQQELEILEAQLREKQKTEAQELQPEPEKEQQQQQVKQQEAPGQEWGGRNSGEKGQGRKRKRNHYRQRRQMAREARQHRFHKLPRLSHAYAHSTYNAGPGIRDQGGQRFSGIRGGPARYRGTYDRSQPRPAYRPDDVTGSAELKI
uniref:Uncharacterized protein n=1 Tax=Avena sativa TaxID=4498 RepID=A0ACD5T872_AVESA